MCKIYFTYGKSIIIGFDSQHTFSFFNLFVILCLIIFIVDITQEYDTYKVVSTIAQYFQKNRESVPFELKAKSLYDLSFNKVYFPLILLKNIYIKSFNMSQVSL